MLLLGEPSTPDGQGVNTSQTHFLQLTRTNYIILSDQFKTMAADRGATWPLTWSHPLWWCQTVFVQVTEYQPDSESPSCYYATTSSNNRMTTLKYIIIDYTISWQPKHNKTILMFVKWQLYTNSSLKDNLDMTFSDFLKALRLYDMVIIFFLSPSQHLSWCFITNITSKAILHRSILTETLPYI